MSRWEKHIRQQHSDRPSQTIGEKVDYMNIQEEGPNGQSFKLECLCGQVFWFEDKANGLNSVQRIGKEGIPEQHAKCPTCGREWDGDESYYYVAGFISQPPPSIRHMAMEMSDGQTDLSHLNLAYPIAAIQAANGYEALTKIKLPKDLRPDITRDGCILIRVKKERYDAVRRFIEERFTDPGPEDVESLLREFREKVTT